MTLLEQLAQKTLVGDGAMGSQLQNAGLEPGGCGEAWNIEYPDRVLAIQRGYVAAGSDCLTTNTFGGCRVMLERHALGHEVAAINRAAVEIAREAFGDRPGFVIGDIGPFGGLMEPYGEVPEADVRDAFGEQARALVDAGADAIIIETQTAFEELKLGIDAAREAGATCVIGSMAYDVGQDESQIFTMMGIHPQMAAEFLSENGADIVALNCGTGMDMQYAEHAVRVYRETCNLPLMAQPNAGLPELIKMKVHYGESPEQMAAGVPGLLAAGANIVGACCGSTADHIRLIRATVDQHAET